MKVFCDLDGVLADLETGHEQIFGRRPDRESNDVNWPQVNAEMPDFFLRLPPMADMRVLWGAIEHLKPIILTGVPKIGFDQAADYKRRWVKEYVGSGVEVRCCRASEKYIHAEPGDILIDDWEKYRKQWVEAGGMWITHRSAHSTITVLRIIGVLS